MDEERETADVSVAGKSPGKKVHDRMLTALGSVCFYGTAYYAEEIVGDKSNRCPIEDNPDHKSTSKTVTTEEEKSETVGDPMPGAKRFNTQFRLIDSLAYLAITINIYLYIIIMLYTV